jgi:hypothetical protein
MPTSADHLAWAAQNENAFKKMRAKWPDWAMTALFYTALHEVQALFLDTTSDRPVQHSGRNAKINANWGASIYAPYTWLYQRSRTARYDCAMPSEAKLNEAVLSLAKFRLGVEAVRTAAGKTV